jgi:hypothetical protein
MQTRWVATVIAITVTVPAHAAPVFNGQPTAETVVSPAPPVLLRRDTPVELMAYSEISTASVTAGSPFKLRVNQPIVVNGRVVVPVGAWAHGEIIAASRSGTLGKAGAMTARLRYLKLGDAEVPLNGEIAAKGTGAGSAGAALVLAGVSGLFFRGNNAKIKAGEIVSAFVAEDVLLDLSANPIRRALSIPKVSE